jgi:hypothetical protein
MPASWTRVVLMREDMVGFLFSRRS